MWRSVGHYYCRIGSAGHARPKLRQRQNLGRNSDTGAGYSYSRRLVCRLLLLQVLQAQRRRIKRARATNGDVSIGVALATGQFVSRCKDKSEDPATMDEYREQAEETITTDNAEAELEKTIKEINKDIEAETE